MLQYPTYPDGRLIRPGDIYSFDSGTQLGLIIYVYPNEAVIKDGDYWNKYKVPECGQIVSHYIGYNSLIYLSIEDFYEEGQPEFVVNINIEKIYNILQQQHKSENMVKYQQNISYWEAMTRSEITPND